MGRIMQNRLVRKLDLEIMLSKIKQHPSPKAYLEQYTIPPEVAAELLHIATYTYDDITEKVVADLGCGTGRLAIGSCLLGAKETVGVDIDKIATKIALKNAEKLQNPPFGVQKRKADLKFLEMALKIGKRIYSLHKGARKKHRFAKKLETTDGLSTSISGSPFLRSFIERHGGQIRAIYTMPMTIPFMFDFHRKRKYRFPVDLYIIEK